jgi:hypothetical protein
MTRPLLCGACLEHLARGTFPGLTVQWTTPTGERRTMQAEHLAALDELLGVLNAYAVVPDAALMVSAAGERVGVLADTIVRGSAVCRWHTRDVR